jgi:hypothetical protein
MFSMFRAVGAGLLFGALTIHATPNFALNFNLANNDGNYNDGFDRTVGWGFTPNQNILVTALGVYDPTGNGTGNTHTAGIWTLGGGTLVTSEVVSGGVETGAFRFLSLTTPVILLAGTEYVIGSTVDEINNGEGFTWTPVNSTSCCGNVGVPAADMTYDNTDLTFDSGGAFVVNTSPSTSLTYPNTQDSTRPQYFGPDFQFQVLPEPAPALLVAVGLGLLAMVRMRRIRPTD